MIWCILVLIQGYITNFNSPKSDAHLIRESGWALAAKLGHSPNRWSQILATCPFVDTEKQGLNIGFGWGISAALFEGLTLDESSKKQVESNSILIQY